MGRPSNTEQRRKEILDAFGACISRYGVEATTLERIAEEAGLARALLRHHVGNRDEIFDAFVARFFRDSDKSTQQLLDALPSDDRSATLVDWLFDAQLADVDSVRITDALANAATHRPKLRAQLREWLRGFSHDIANVLRDDFPNQSEERVVAVATGIAGLYAYIDGLTPLGSVQDIRAHTLNAATLLLHSLESKA